MLQRFIRTLFPIVMDANAHFECLISEIYDSAPVVSDVHARAVLEIIGTEALDSTNLMNIHKCLHRCIINSELKRIVWGQVNSALVNAPEYTVESAWYLMRRHKVTESNLTIIKSHLASFMESLENVHNSYMRVEFLKFFPLISEEIAKFFESEKQQGLIDLDSLEQCLPYLSKERASRFIAILGNPDIEWWMSDVYFNSSTSKLNKQTLSEYCILTLGSSMSDFVEVSVRKKKWAERALVMILQKGESILQRGYSVNDLRSLLLARVQGILTDSYLVSIVLVSCQEYLMNPRYSNDSHIESELMMSAFPQLQRSIGERLLQKADVDLLEVAKLCVLFPEDIQRRILDKIYMGSQSGRVIQALWASTQGEGSHWNNDSVTTERFKRLLQQYLGFSEVLFQAELKRRGL